MAPTAVAPYETRVPPSNGKVVKDDGKVFNPFYSPSIGDDGDDSYEHAQFKVGASKTAYDYHHLTITTPC
jgi:sulfonate dioxygenase